MSLPRASKQAPLMPSKAINHLPVLPGIPSNPINSKRKALLCPFYRWENPGLGPWANTQSTAGLGLPDHTYSWSGPRYTPILGRWERGWLYSAPQPPLHAVMRWPGEGEQGCDPGHAVLPPPSDPSVPRAQGADVRSLPSGHMTGWPAGTWVDTLWWPSASAGQDGTEVLE